MYLKIIRRVVDTAVNLYASSSNQAVPVIHKRIRERIDHTEAEHRTNPVFPISGVFRLKGQSKRDDGMIFRSCKASQSPVYPIRDAILAVNHASCPSLSSSGPPRRE